MREGILEKSRTRGLYLRDSVFRNRWVSCCYLVVFIPDNAFFL